MQFNKLAGFCINILKIKLYLNTAPPPKKKVINKIFKGIVASAFSQDGVTRTHPETTGKIKQNIPKWKNLSSSHWTPGSKGQRSMRDRNQVCQPHSQSPRSPGSRGATGRGVCAGSGWIEGDGEKHTFRKLDLDLRFLSFHLRIEGLGLSKRVFKLTSSILFLNNFIEQQFSYPFNVYS